MLHHARVKYGLYSSYHNNCGIKRVCVVEMGRLPFTGVGIDIVYRTATCPHTGRILVGVITSTGIICGGPNLQAANRK